MIWTFLRRTTFPPFRLYLMASTLFIYDLVISHPFLLCVSWHFISPYTPALAQSLPAFGWETTYSVLHDFCSKATGGIEVPSRGTRRESQHAPSATINTLMMTTNGTSFKITCLLDTFLQQLMGDHLRHHESKPKKRTPIPSGEHP